jgi:hypothetical protein
MSAPTARDPAGAEQTEAAHQELERLKRWAAFIAAFLVALIVVGLVVTLVLLDDARTTDLRRLAVLAILAGVLGGAAGAMIEVIELVGTGWELANGTRFSRRKRGQPTVEPPETRARRKGRAGDATEPHEDGRTEGSLAPHFSAWDIPGLVAYPLVGATCGFVVFAGVVGGFLLASGTEADTYSAPGMLFLAFLAGIFSRHFLNRLKASAEALFGEDPEAKRLKDEAERAQQAGMSDRRRGEGAS